MTLEAVFDDFMLDRRLRGLTDRSMRDYEEFIRPFLKFVGMDLEASALTFRQVQEYIAGIYARNVTKATVGTYVRHLKAFVHWMEEEELITFPASKIKVPKTPKKLVKIYTPEEIRQIFASVAVAEEWITARNQAMVALMLDAGLRQAEVRTLLRDDVYFSDSLLKVCGKGEKDRILPFGDLSRKCIEKYLELCPYENKELFADVHGNMLSSNAVKQLFSKASKKLPFPVSSHKLRHNFATNYCVDHYEKDGQVDIYKLMVLMGHSDVSVTMVYLHHANQILASKGNISHLDVAVVSF